MNTFKNLFLGPLGVLATFLLACLINYMLDISGEGLWRLIAFIPVPLVLIAWIKSSGAKK